MAFFHAGPNDTPTFVDFETFTLHVDHGLWEDAELGVPEAREKIAHEIGHIFLHNRGMRSFTNDAGGAIKFAEKEHSAEWQAHCFARYFLLPLRFVQQQTDAIVAASNANVPLRIAEVQIAIAND